MEADDTSDILKMSKEKIYETEYDSETSEQLDEKCSTGLGYSVVTS